MKAVECKPHYDTSVLNSISIKDIAARFQELKRSGNTYRTNCPWHTDEHPSLVLYENSHENRCHCFACGNGGGPISYVMQQTGLGFLDACAWLAKEFNCGITNGEAPIVIVKNKRPTQKQETLIAKEYTYIPMDIVDDMVSTESSFIKCMMQVFDPFRVEFLVNEYKLGCYEYNAEYYDDVVFPCIDEKGRIHNLKVQNYCTDQKSADFFHSRKNHCFWIGKDLINKGLLPKDAIFDNDCMFGAHLLNKYPSAPVVLVESPKNAIIGAAINDDAIWVATGNKSMLKENVLHCLKGRDVIVYPDRDAISGWSSALSTAKMRALANFKVCDFCETKAPEGQAKFDIADYILSGAL